MDYKKELDKHFWDSKWLTQSRYNASKNMFIYFSLIFFLNYFFVWAKFLDEVFLFTLPITYISFLTTIGFFIFFYFKKTFDFKMVYNIIVAILTTIILFVFLFPFSWISL